MGLGTAHARQMAMAWYGMARYGMVWYGMALAVKADSTEQDRTGQDKTRVKRRAQSTKHGQPGRAIAALLHST
jgi:hypothetical protein